MTDRSFAYLLAYKGAVTFEALPDLTLQAEWLLREPRPSVRAMLNALFAS